MDDSLEAFASERTSSPRPRAFERSESVGRRTVAAGVLAFSLLPALVLASYGLNWVQSASTHDPRSASLIIESDPAGAEVHVAGSRRGTTPLRLQVAPGHQTVEVVLGEHRQSFGVVAREGTDVVHRVAFVAAPAPSAVPVKTSGSAAGRRPAPVGPPRGPVAGWLSVQSPVRLQVFEGSQVIGTTDVPRIMLAAGRHHLRFTSAERGFSDVRLVTVQPGQSTSVTIDVPRSRLDLGALPDVEAWSEAAPVGATEIGGLGLPIGADEVVLPPEPVASPLPGRGAFVAPVAVQEDLPPWMPPSGLAGRAAYAGVFRILIGADGQVTGSEVVQASHPLYDAALSRAARTWLYRPATRDGRPVPSVKDIQIRLVPR